MIARIPLFMRSGAIAAVVWSPCAQAQGAQEVDIHDGDAYRALLGQAERALEAGQLGELQSLVDTLRLFDMHEVPTYEWRLFDVALLIERGRLDDARSELDAFEDMLRIESGVWRCGISSGSIHRNGQTRQSPVAYSQMCAEAYLGYYNPPTQSALQRVAEAWSLTAEVRARLDDSASRP